MGWLSDCLFCVLWVCLLVLGLFVGWLVLGWWLLRVLFLDWMGVWNCFALVEFNCCILCLVFELGRVGCCLLRVCFCCLGFGVWVCCLGWLWLGWGFSLGLFAVFVVD